MILKNDVPFQLGDPSGSHVAAHGNCPVFFTAYCPLYFFFERRLRLLGRGKPGRPCPLLRQSSCRAAMPSATAAMPSATAAAGRDACHDATGMALLSSNHGQPPTTPPRARPPRLIPLEAIPAGVRLASAEREPRAKSAHHLSMTEEGSPRSRPSDRVQLAMRTVRSAHLAGAPLRSPHPSSSLFPPAAFCGRPRPRRASLRPLQSSSAAAMPSAAAASGRTRCHWHGIVEFEQ